MLLTAMAAVITLAVFGLGGTVGQTFADTASGMAPWLGAGC